MKISQAQFIEQLAVKCGITVSQAGRFVDRLKRLVYLKLSEGNSVALSGFGQFSVSHRAARIGYNPRTKLPITIPELKTPKFKAGEAFKQAVAIKS